MTEPLQEETTPPATESRSGNRRGRDRRRTERRAPPPMWRRPWAFIGYGVAATLVLVLVFGGNDERPAAPKGALAPLPVPPAVDTLRPPAASAPPQDAYSTGDFARLLAEGPAAAGQRVRTTLYCESIIPMNVVREPETKVAPSLAALMDADGRVPAAECSWGAGANAPDFLLLVPPALAERFAAAPVVTLGFVKRRKLSAEVQWLGRSDALALNTAGVLDTILR